MSKFTEFLGKVVDVASEVYNTKLEIDKMSHCKPMYLGEAHWSNSIHDGSNDNVVRLKNDEVVIANTGDCVKYCLRNYRWDGKKWERLG